MSVDDGPGDDRPQGAPEPFDPWKPVATPPPSAGEEQPAPIFTSLDGRREQDAASGAPVFVKAGQSVDEALAARSGETPDPEERPWRWYVGPSAILIALVGVTLVSVVAVVIVSLLSPGHPSTTQVTDDNEHWFGLGQDVLWIVIALITPFLFAGYLRAGQLGMRRPPRWGKAIGVFAATIAVFYLVALAYATIFHLDDNSNSLLDTDSGFGDSVVQDVAFALLYTVAAPVAEELLFRGLLFRTIRDGFAKRWRRSSPWTAALVSGVIFGGIHYSPAAANQNNFLPVLMALGFLLAIAYNFSGTIYVNIAIHAINNAIATGTNTNPTHDWVYVLIGVGPLLALALTFVLSRIVRAVFPGEPPNRAHPPTAQPAIV